jgi:hypothetical protein
MREPTKRFQDLVVWQKAHQEDLGYGECNELQSILTEVSKLLEAYSQAILTTE